MADLRRVYLDACCIIDLVRVELSLSVVSEREQDAWHVKKLMEAHRDGEVVLFTSTLTIAECRHAGENPVTEQIKSQFSRLLMSGQYLKLVQVTPFITEDARDLTWKHGLNLKGADSIHVASAIDRKCGELLTSDHRLERLKKHSQGLALQGLACKSARDTECLPAKYLQLELGDGVLH